MVPYRTIAKEIDQQRFLGCLILFFIWPFIGTIVGLLSIKKPNYKCILLGVFISVIGLNTLYVNVSGDAVRYAFYFTDICRNGLNINKILAEGRLDVIPFISMKIVSWASSDPCVLFAFWGGIWGVFAYLTCHTAATIAPLGRFYMIAFMLILFWINAPTNMHTYRFFVDVWIFMYILLKAELNKGKKWMILLLITPFIHTAFIIPCLIYYLYKLSMGRKMPIKLLTVSYVACFAISTFDNITRSLTSYGYFLMDTRYGKYISDREIDALAMMQEQSNTSVQFANNLAHYGCFIVILLIQYFINKNKNMLSKCNITLSLDRILLIFASFSSLVSFIPSTSRYNILSNIIMVIIAFYLLSIKVIKSQFLMLSLILISFLGPFYLAFVKIPERYDLNFMLPLLYLKPLF